MSNYFSLLIFIIIRCSFVNAVLDQSNLQMISVLFRHGDREINPTQRGALTNVGRLRAYHLGEILRAKYGDFLGDIYDPKAVSAYSTEYDRAKMSLQLLLASLYMPHTRQRWHKSLAWQPIPHFYKTRDQDILLFPRYCPRFFKELEKAKSSPEYQKLLEPFRDLMEYLEFFTGKEIKESFDMFLLYHSLKAMHSMNETLPQWAENYFPNGLLLNGTFLEYHAMKFNDWMRKINGGTYLRKTIDDMLSKVNNSMGNQAKVYLYSSHELIITAVLQSLNIWTPHVPEYTSAIILELLKESEDYFVKVLYHKGIPATTTEMQIPGCSNPCPLELFIDSVSDQLPDYDEIICDDDEPMTLRGN
ncbi:hypothetical protein QAD02_017803 [Eretmocerus hayati]|uniref:Uncharacterized protein n=1 Tax=Eretmocerus hayati TaxID=131215 RepID=A0ACC2PEW7_9HYME|nr:hypothetical protein QAD02_017803 [Eretmocerus hayati]